MNKPSDLSTNEKDFTTEVLESLNWPKDNKFIPVANSENRKLLELISKLSEEKLSKSKQNENEINRVSGIKYHIENSVQEIDENLKLIHATRNESITDENLLKLAHQEENRLIQLSNEVKKSCSKLEKHDSSTQFEIEKITKNLNELSDQIQWAKGAMDEFRQAMEHGEAVKELIEKYCKMDATRADVLESKRKIIQENITKQREKLVNMCEEQKSQEQILERASQLYRKSHMERRHMIGRWRDAVNQMNQREADIRDSEMELRDSVAMTTELEVELGLQTDFLNQHIQNNRDTERATAELNIYFSNLKSRVTELTDVIGLKTNELSMAKKNVYNVSQRLNQQRQKNRQNTQEKDTKSTSLEKEIELFADLQSKAEKFKNKNCSAQERLRQLDEMIETEEKNIRILHQELSRFSGALFRSQQQLKSFQSDEKILHLEKESLSNAISNTKSNIKSQEKELLRQTETVYNVDFNIQLLEKRINNMKGVGCEKNDELDAKLLHLQSLHRKKHKDLQLLQSQASKAEDDMKKLTLNFNNDALEYEKLFNYLKERQMHTEGGEKDVLRQIATNQERRVDESILKMKIHLLEKEIRDQDNKSFNLEKHRLSLNVTMKERLLDISTQRDMLYLKRKNYSEEISQLRADIGERNLKIEALKARYVCVLELLGRNDDGTVVNATQIKVRNAQEKHILLKEGNELNEKVLQAEDDIKAMENTVRLMNYSNENYRRNVENYEEPNPLVHELKDVQQQYCKAVNNLKALNATYQSKMEMVEKLDVQKTEIEKAMENIQLERNEKNDTLLKIHKELMDQKVKMQRAERELKQSLKSCKAKIIDAEIMALFEKDLNAKELEERNSSALQQMADFIENNSDVGPYMKKSMFEKGIAIPFTRSKSQVSIRSNISAAGSDYSLAMSSGSSKASAKSTDSHVSSKKSGATPSIVMIDFPGNTSMRSSNLSTKRTAKF